MFSDFPESKLEMLRQSSVAERHGVHFSIATNLKRKMASPNFPPEQTVSC